MGQRASGLWAAVRESLSGSERDYTQGPINRAIVLLAIPMVLEMAMESLFALVDIFWVARLGKSAAAAVGLTESIETLVYAVAVGISAGATAMVARRIGEKDHDGAAIAAVQALVLGLGAALLIGIPGAILAPHLLGWMGADPEVIAVGSGFTRVLQLSAPVIMLLFLINAVFRGAGDAAIAMRVLWVANLINIALDPCLIFGLGPFPETRRHRRGRRHHHRPVRRSRTSDLRSFHERSRVRISRRHLRLDPVILARLARVSFTGMLQFLIPNGSWLALVRIMSMFGSAALAGYTIAIRIVIFSILPSWGLSNAAATLVGQNLGAGLPQRAEESVWKTGLFNMCFLGIIGLLFLTAPAFLVGLFTHDPAVQTIGVDCLRILSYGYLFYAYGMVMVQAFNGAGDTATPTFINLGCYWCLQIPLAWFLAVPAGLEERGAFWAVPAAESILAVVSILIFRRGRWKLKKI